MKTRYKLLGVVTVYLIGNALYSDSTSMFVGHLIGHSFIAVLLLFLAGVICMANESDLVRKVQRSPGLVERFKNAFRSWWHKPRPLLDVMIQLLTNPVARQRLIREANTGQLELQLDE